MTRESWILGLLLVLAAWQTERSERRARQAKADAWKDLLAKIRRLADSVDASGRPADHRHAETLRGMANAWHHRGEPS